MPIPARTYSRHLRASDDELMEKLLEDVAISSTLSVETLMLGGESIRRYSGEFWTSRQRQACSLHEISYRACFKPQLPRLFIERLTQPGDTVYDPFMGRGTTLIEAALLGRLMIGNDVNPLSRILTRPRLCPPKFEEVSARLDHIRIGNRERASFDLSMFFHSKTEREIVALRSYLSKRVAMGREDNVDRWIRMVATNRLTGHSRGFFSVYTLPPNQAMSPENQRRVNRNLRQRPEYRDVKTLILKKTKSLLRNISETQQQILQGVHSKARFATTDAWRTTRFADDSIVLTVTSPPFLDTVNYADDNWLRFWFNGIDRDEIERRITMVSTLQEWSETMTRVLKELHRITRPEGIVAFEVGEIRKRNLMLDEVVVPIGLQAGFRCAGILVNRQKFTKTSNIWGIKNNKAGTNTNRIVVFQKSHQSHN